MNKLGRVVLNNSMLVQGVRMSFAKYYAKGAIGKEQNLG